MSEQREWIQFKALLVRQPFGEFYLGVLDSRDLTEIAWADVQAIGGQGSHQLHGIERPLSRARVEELEEYVNRRDASFPTPIVLSVSANDWKCSCPPFDFSILKRSNVAKILDGQHRVEGLKKFSGDREDKFECAVVIFVEIPLDKEANIFSTINLKQTKVSRSLAYNLLEYESTRSPQKTAHDIATRLNRSPGPFEGRIKILGKVTRGNWRQTITQAAFIERLLPLITDDAERDRAVIKRNDAAQLTHADPGSRRIFRNAFINEDDALIEEIVTDYFTAVERRWPLAWNSRTKGEILGKTTGFAALMRILPDLITLRCSNLESIRGQTVFFLDMFQKSNLKDDYFTTKTYKPGSTGENDLARDLWNSLRLGVKYSERTPKRK